LPTGLIGYSEEPGFGIDSSDWMNDSGSGNHHKTMRHMIVELDDETRAPTTNQPGKAAKAAAETEDRSWRSPEQVGTKNMV
jgi:hypothetical protein